MPRSGGIYSLPAGSIVANGTTADASQHNTPLNDIAADLNAPRPISAGGTGATTVSAARTALGLGTAAVENIGSFATAAQGALANTAVQPGSLASVATSGAYADLSGLPVVLTQVQATDPASTVSGLITGQRIAQAVAASVAPRYSSPEQAITSGGALTLTHGLGAVPFSVQAYLICKTAENGFQVDDLVPVNPATNAAANIAAGLSMRVTSTQIIVRYGIVANPFEVINATNGNTVQLTSANWRLIVRAEK